MAPTKSSSDFPVGQWITFADNFDQPVVLEEARPLGGGFECPVRLSDGVQDETADLSDEAALRQQNSTGDRKVTPVAPEPLRLPFESARLRLAYAELFAVSLSGIRTPPHQVKAVYEHKSHVATQTQSATPRRVNRCRVVVRL